MMKSLKQKLAKFETKLKNLSNTKPVVGDKSISVLIKPKVEKVYIPLVKRNHKEKTYFARLDKG